MGYARLAGACVPATQCPITSNLVLVNVQYYLQWHKLENIFFQQFSSVLVQEKSLVLAVPARVKEGATMWM